MPRKTTQRQDSKVSDTKKVTKRKADDSDIEEEADVEVLPKKRITRNSSNSTAGKKLSSKPTKDTVSSEENNSEIEEEEPKRSTSSKSGNKSTKSNGAKKTGKKAKVLSESEEEANSEIDEEEEAPKKRNTRAGAGKKNNNKRKKDDTDSEEEFKVDGLSEANSDMEEEDELKRKLASFKLDEGSDFEPLEPWDDAKPKLKRVKKTTTEKSASKGSTSAKTKSTATSKSDSGAKKGTQKDEKAGPKGPQKAKKGVGGNVRVKFQEEEKQGGEEFFPSDEHPQYDESASYIPNFIQEPHIRDKQGRYSNEEGYDPTTLFVPPEELQKCRPLMRQYWNLKSTHFDKLVAIKVWKFYYFYFNDAIIVHRIIDMKLTMWSNSTFTFFHESCMARFAPKLLAAGHKVVIIEQMEEVKKEEEGVVKREICQILTRGTAVENQDLDYSSRFMLAVFEDNLNFGVAFIDTTTHEFYIGEFVDDSHRSNLRTLITRTKPVEVVYMRNFLEQETLNMFKSLFSKPTCSMISFNEPKHLSDIFEHLAKYFINKDTEELNYPELLDTIKQSVDVELKRTTDLQGTRLLEFERKVPFWSTMQALEICAQFLENVLLAETAISMGNFTPFDVTIEKRGTLYLDSQTLQNLEVLDVQYLNVFSETHSLFGYMDYTVSQFGKRMLKRWISSPFLDAQRIKERQEAVEDLMKNPDMIQHFQDRLAKFSDLERHINRVYNLSNKQRMSAIYFEDFAKNRLKEFLTFLGELKKIDEVIDSLTVYLPSLRSKRLIQLACFKDVDIESFAKRKKVVANKGKQKKKGKKEPEEGEEDIQEEKPQEEDFTAPEGIFPRIKDIISDLEGMVEIKEGLPIPSKGINKEVDEIIAKIDEIKSNLQQYLVSQQKKFNNYEIKYVHTKHRYELEIPERLVEGSKRPKEFAITSKRKGYMRFHAPEIEKHLGGLWRIESEFQKVLIPFICDYFKKFYERNNYWQQVINCLGELDCLCSLARLADTMPVKCKPEVLPMGKKPIFDLKGMVHPMAAKNNPKFVPNDVVVENDVDVFLITGPNMGGKSTLLRQSCLAVIMAQVGSFVPAKSFKLSAIDRIFTRIGASDRILEGKSTFFVEMEETYNIMQEATKNSMLIVDELGRGTSTYDGVAIAYATLKYIAEKIGCITLFATHYHLLLEEFKLYKNIDTFFMQCEANEGKDELTFLYKFVKGQALKSHGIIIGKMAGLPGHVVTRAKEKAAFMTSEKRNIGFERSLMEKFNKIMDEAVQIEEGKVDDVDKILVELEQLH